MAGARFLRTTMLFIAIISVFGCGKKEDTAAEEEVSDSVLYIAETAMSQAGSSASASEGGAVGLMGGGFEEMKYVADFVDPHDSIHPLATACTFSSVRGTCASSSDTITWGGCTVAGGALTMTGTWTEVFSGTGASSCTIPVADGGTITRTTTGSVATTAIGATITTDTNGGTAWDGTVIPATGVVISRSSVTRTIVINGLRRVVKGPRGRKWLDHFVTSTGLTATGSRLGLDRSISGTLKVYHNLLEYTATNIFNTVRWEDSSCCYPTSGNISSTLTGSVTGTTTLTFSSTCGVATFVDTSGTSSSKELTHCN